MQALKDTFDAEEKALLLFAGLVRFITLVCLYKAALISKLVLLPAVFALLGLAWLFTDLPALCKAEAGAGYYLDGS